MDALKRYEELKSRKGAKLGKILRAASPTNWISSRKRLNKTKYWSTTDLKIESKLNDLRSKRHLSPSANFKYKIGIKTNAQVSYKPKKYVPIKTDVWRGKSSQNKLNTIKPKFAEIDFESSDIITNLGHQKKKSIVKKKNKTENSYDKHYCTGTEFTKVDNFLICHQNYHPYFRYHR
jgi:hypothetical protein